MIRERKSPKPRDAGAGQMGWERLAAYRAKLAAAASSGEDSPQNDAKRSRGRLRAKKARLLTKLAVTAEGTASHAGLSQTLKEVRSLDFDQCVLSVDM